MDEGDRSDGGDEPDRKTGSADSDPSTTAISAATTETAATSRFPKRIVRRVPGKVLKQVLRTPRHRVTNAAEPPTIGSKLVRPDQNQVEGGVKRDETEPKRTETRILPAKGSCTGSVTTERGR